MRFSISLALVGLLCSHAVYAQAIGGGSGIVNNVGAAPALVLGSEIIPSSAPTNQYQQTIRVSPINPNVMTIVTKTGYSETAPYAFNTQNGGSTWTSTAVGVASASDPDLQYDLTGNAWWSFIDHTNSATGVRKSADGGGTWGIESQIAMVVDHPVVAIDRTAGAHAGRIYVVGASLGGTTYPVAHSDDGSSWTIVNVDVSAYSDLKFGGLFSGSTGVVYDPVVTSNGTLLIPVAGADTDHALTFASSHNLYIFKSTDGGGSFSIIGPVVTKVYPNVLPAWLQGGYFGFSNLAVGPKPSGGDRVYVVYSQVTASSPATHSLYISDDLGGTWSGPTTIASLATRSASGMSLAVNAVGVVGVQFVGVSMDASTFDLWFYYLENGTWSTPVQVPGASSKYLAVPSQEPRAPGEDQVSLGVGPNGKFYTVWPDNRANTTSVYTTYVRQVTVD